MKNKIAIAVILLTCLSLAIPSLGYSRRYYGPYRGCHSCGYYRSNDYWVPAAVMAGSILVGAVIVGAIAQSSRQQCPPGRTSCTAAPYASPDPAFVNKYGRSNTAGEWVIVPGQQVGDKYVPAHRVFIPKP